MFKHSRCAEDPGLNPTRGMFIWNCYGPAIWSRLQAPHLSSQPRQVRPQSEESKGKDTRKKGMIKRGNISPVIKNWHIGQNRHC